MSGGQAWVLAPVLFLNGAGSLLYLLAGCLVYTVRRRKALAGFAEGEATTEDMDAINGARTRGTKHVIQVSIVCFVSPVLGAIFFFLSWVIRKTLLRREVDAEKTVFAKDKAPSRAPANVESEQDLIPLEEALTLADERNRRKIVLGVVKQDASSSLGGLLQALNNDDSETAHYAASVLSDVLNDFRANVQKLENELEEYKASPRKKDKAIHVCVQMQDYMAPFLAQHVFADLEQEGFVNSMDSAAQYLWENGKDEMKPQHFQNLVRFLLELKKEDRCEFWCSAVTEQYPDDLISYKCCLMYYFDFGKTDRFFAKIEELKRSGIMIDADTLELVRIFSQKQ